MPDELRLCAAEMRAPGVVAPGPLVRLLRKDVTPGAGRITGFTIRAPPCLWLGDGGPPTTSSSSVMYSSAESAVRHFFLGVVLLPVDGAVSEPAGRLTPPAGVTVAKSSSSVSGAERVGGVAFCLNLERVVLGGGMGDEAPSSSVGSCGGGGFRVRALERVERAGCAAAGASVVPSSSSSSSLAGSDGTGGRGARALERVERAGCAAAGASVVPSSSSLAGSDGTGGRGARALERVERACAGSVLGCWVLASTTVNTGCLRPASDMRMLVRRRPAWADDRRWDKVRRVETR